MTGYTDPDLLPFPNDYNVPADVPADVEALAVATQALITEQQAIIANLAPIGVILMWPQASAPPGWHLCNGTAHGSPALQAVLGSPNTPNLADRFIVAAGASYGVGAQGGAAAIQLSPAESGLRNHAHTGSTGFMDRANVHAHPSPLALGPWNGVNQDADTSARSSPTRYASFVNPTGAAADTNHTHAVTVDASGEAWAVAAHENRPPYYALTYIIRKS